MMLHSTNTYWRVFYTAPRAEKRCEERLQRAQINVFLPKYVAEHQWKDRKKKVMEPLFRSYIFAHVNEQERLRVLQTDGIVLCVAFGGKPAVITDEEIEQLKITQNDPERLAVLQGPVPNLGDEVTIEAGPFRGLHGKVLEQRGEVHLVVQIVGIRQAVRVHVPAAWLLKPDKQLGSKL